MHVLFVCSGNTCRSPMAEALARHAWNEMKKDGDPEIRFSSAGTGAFAGDEASTGAVLAMKARGIDISRHRSRPATRAAVLDADIVLTMTENHRRALLSHSLDDAAKIRLLSPRGDIQDPFGGSIEIYETVARLIDEAVRSFLTTLKR